MKINSGNFLNYFTPIVKGKYLKTENLFVFLAPPKKSALDVGWINPKILNVTCQAIDIYPEPQLNIRITTHQR